MLYHKHTFKHKPSLKRCITFKRLASHLCVKMLFFKYDKIVQERVHSLSYAFMHIHNQRQHYVSEYLKKNRFEKLKVLKFSLWNLSGIVMMCWCYKSNWLCSCGFSQLLDWSYVTFQLFIACKIHQISLRWCMDCLKRSKIITRKILQCQNIFKFVFGKPYVWFVMPQLVVIIEL